MYRERANCSCVFVTDPFIGTGTVSASAGRLAQLVGSRICHDLVSPIGAIGNGLELLQMGNIGPSEEMDLVLASLKNADARLRFFRVAFGAASSEQIFPRSDALNIVEAMNQSARVIIDWRPMIDTPRSALRLAFLLLQCMETALPRGGRVRVEEDAGQWLIEGTGPRADHDAAYWDVLRGVGEDDMPTKSNRVHFALAFEAATELATQLELELSAEVLRIRF
ncbi:MAG: histidine phosphotransferase family protein [Pseudomonadota bacterium]